MQLAELRRRLAKRSQHPANLPGAQYLSEGSARVAYRVGRWVVKDYDASWRCSSTPSPAKRIPGLYRTVQTRRVGGRWEIQPYVGPTVRDMLAMGAISYDYAAERLNAVEEHANHWGDLHYGNITITRSGEVVQFD